MSAHLDTGTALVRSILHAPEDDAPRLVYADFLDDNGESERAALIRRMIAAPTYRFAFNQGPYAARPKHEHKEPIRAIRGLKARLAVVCGPEWVAWPDVRRVVVRRGFAEEVTVEVLPFLRDAGRLFAAHPIERVEFYNLFPRWSIDDGPKYHAVLARRRPGFDRWPAQLFPDCAAGATIGYPSSSAAKADLSRRAATSIIASMGERGGGFNPRL